MIFVGCGNLGTSLQHFCGIPRACLPSSSSKRRLLAIPADFFADRQSCRQEYFFLLNFLSIMNFIPRTLFRTGKKIISSFIISVLFCTLQSRDKPIRYNVKLLVLSISKERCPKVLTDAFLEANKRKKNGISGTRCAIQAKCEWVTSDA